MFKLSTKKNEQPKWKDIEYFNKRWKKRICLMSKLINENEKSIIDLGCGKMWLKKYLSSNCTYYGCDYRKRNKNTIICDFNLKEFPNIHTDVAFVSGCLEYIDDVPWFIAQISEHCNTLILSYCSMDKHNDIAIRRKRAWVNHYYEDELINIIQKTKCRVENQSNEIDGNIILRFS
jgi:hypothetical protein